MNHFDQRGRFIFEDFNRKRPFSSFLPGVAGLHGIPMWVFYVNRGQGVCSFGVENKDHPILEFQAANIAYQNTARTGFRTFLRASRAGQQWHQEAFSPWGAENVQRRMFIGMNELEIRETNTRLGYQISVLYFMLPNAPFSGLVRRVSFTNLLDSPLKLEVLDGLPGIVPYGVDNGALKNISRTIEAWMHVENLENKMPFYRLKATPGDTADVRAIHSGNYGLAFHEGKRLVPVADPSVIFGLDTSHAAPHHFYEKGLQSVLESSQVLEGRTLCAFFGTTLSLEPEETQTITSLYGYSASLPMLASRAQAMESPAYFDQKLQEARAITEDLTGTIQTESSSAEFDGYARQTFLDNLVRGGYPIRLDDQQIYHVYSRKHGDIERDYNYFVIPPEFYSQGNGNYRDVNQNRRNDVFFVPQAGEFNIRTFMSLIQADGYNPLVILGQNFSVPEARISELLADAGHKDKLANLLAGNFTPGDILDAANDAELSIPPETFMENIFSEAESHIHAEHGEGYWIDHWTYNLDLIEAYLAIFPDRKAQLLFDSDPLPFFDNAHVVQPRAARFVLYDGDPMQLNAVVEDQEKDALIAARNESPHWARSKHGQGDIFRLPLYSKLALLALIKFATLDPSGMGIQMEAGKPGWYDAMNGLPGLNGSSMPETCELLRLVDFLIEAGEGSSHKIQLPVEAIGLMVAIEETSNLDSDPFSAWDERSSALEAYRASIKLGFNGGTTAVDLQALLPIMRKNLQRAITKARSLAEDLMPTYLIHEVTDYELTGTSDVEGRPHIRPTGFSVKALPNFLEGPARLMKVLDQKDAQDLAQAVKDSDLLDKALKMYKVNASLEDQPFEIGRARAFTPGWLENESIWMHMAFKYLLELQKAGLYSEFFEDLRSHLPAFMDPDIYGRSPLENSSFIVSSAHPDPSLHGNGFVARLSGSTAEFLSMWTLMVAGKQPYRVEDGELVLRLQPALPGWMFDGEGKFAFRFLGSCKVILHNPSKQDTFGEGQDIKKIELCFGDTNIRINSAHIGSPFAEKIRNGEINLIQLYY